MPNMKHVSPERADSVNSKGEDVYKENVNHLMAINSQEIISNSMPQHAAILLECFFRNANKEVKIVSNNLQRDIYEAGDVLSSFLAAIRRGVSVQIIVRNEIEADNQFAQATDFISQEFPEKVFMKCGANDTEAFKETKANFAVMDGKAFRLEVDPTKCQAYASMNLPVVAKNLQTLFDRLYASLTNQSTFVETPA